MNKKKYRAWNGAEWLNTNEFELQDLNETNIIFQQYTDYNDKNNKEACEGDILCPFGQENITTNRVVIIKEKLTDISFNNFTAKGTHRNFKQDFLPDYYIIIGNIFNNPELLEV